MTAAPAQPRKDRGRPPGRERGLEERDLAIRGLASALAPSASIRTQSVAVERALRAYERSLESRRAVEGGPIEILCGTILSASGKRTPSREQLRKIISHA